MSDERASAVSLPFREQAEFFRRKVNVPTASYRDMQRGDHAHGFMVAGASRLELLDDLRKAVDKAVLGGVSIGEFRRDFDALAARHGWAYQGGRNWRTRIIYSANVRSAYEAGRWEQIQAIKRRRPYLQYMHNDSVRHPRPEHQAWHGTILHADDPWWTTHYTPNGYGCMCYIVTLAERDLKRMGKEGPDEAPTAVDDVAGIDPGFDYNVGAAAGSLPVAQRFGQRLMQLPEAWRDIALADAQRRAPDTFADWPLTMRRVRDAAAPAAPAVVPVGFLRSQVPRALAQPPATALLVTDDAPLRRVLQSTSAGDAAALAKVLDDLPAHLADDATAVLLDEEDALVYAVRLDDGRYARLVFAIGDGAQANRLRQADIVTATILRGYKRVSGTQ